MSRMSVVDDVSMEEDIEQDLVVELDEEDLGEALAHSPDADFGEFLVERGVINRAELFEALREQSQQPGIPLSEIVSWLGYARYDDLDRLRTAFSHTA